MNEEEAWISLIQEAMQRWPAMAVQDVYKLLYQGVRGPEHIMPDAEIFSSRLRQEIDRLQPDSHQMLLEPIRPDSGLSRIHLRAWMALGKDFDILVQACLEAGKRRWGTPEELQLIWRRFYDLRREGFFPSIHPGQADEFHQWLEIQGYPPVHHSRAFAEQYHPAYRLIGDYPI